MLRRAVLVTLLQTVLLLAAAADAGAALPVITYSLSGTAGLGDWFVSGVTVSWAVNFQGTPIDSSGCAAAIRITGDTPGTTRMCTATNADGTVSASTRLIRIDATPPVVTGIAPGGPPDPSGFYRAPVSLVWAGADAMSGIAACTAVVYSGPDGPASVPGVCSDAAGNTSAPALFALLYDATPPGLVGVTARGGDQLATVRWTASADGQPVTVTRSPGVAGAPTSVVFRGVSDHVIDRGLANGVRYTYAVTATDAAGNAVTVSAVTRPRSFLLSPGPGARRTGAPLLRWRRVHGAAYYNVQLFRGGRKVLSAWPRSPHLRLHRRWRFGGRAVRLSRGAYTWYVWPGFGPRAAQRYGRLLGARRLVIR